MTAACMNARPLRNWFFPLFWIAACILTSCAHDSLTTVPPKATTVTPQTSLPQFEEEKWQDIHIRNQHSSQKELTQVVIEAGLRLLAELDQDDTLPWTFHLFQGVEADAFCLAEGQICLREGFFLFVQNEAELAAVLAHQLAHALALHEATRFKHIRLVNQGKITLTTNLETDSSDDAQSWVMAYTGSNQYGLSSPYSRLQEELADRIALRILAKAGYDPQVAIAFWLRHADESKHPVNLHHYLTTHPCTPGRIQSLQNILPEAISIYRASTQRGKGATFSVAK